MVVADLSRRVRKKPTVPKPKVAKVSVVRIQARVVRSSASWVRNFAKELLSMATSAFAPPVVSWLMCFPLLEPAKPEKAAGPKPTQAGTYLRAALNRLIAVTGHISLHRFSRSCSSPQILFDCSSMHAVHGLQTSAHPGHLPHCFEDRLHFAFADRAGKGGVVLLVLVGVGHRKARYRPVEGVALAHVPAERDRAS